MTVHPKLVWRVECRLGEGPVWLHEPGILIFVDIKGGAIHHFNPATGHRESKSIGGMPSFVMPNADGGLLVGSHNSIHLLLDGHIETLVTIPEPVHNRTNDATVGPDGRLWFGTMDDNETLPTGAIWCLDHGKLRRACGEAVVTNGPALSGDGRWLYYADSGARTIWKYRIESDGMPASGVEFLRLSEADGYPDGIIVDAEDCLWVALWDGWGVRRYSAEGKLLMHVPLPCARVTKVALGGADLRTAYVTTARIGLSANECMQQPLAGSLFAFEAPAPGRPLPQVRLA